LEAIARVLVVRFERDEDAIADVVEDLAAVRLLAPGNLHPNTPRAQPPPAPGPAPPTRHRLEASSQIVKTGRREGEAIVRAVEPGPVGDRRHLDRRLGAVGEGVVHFRVEVALGDLFFGPAEEAPDGVRRGVAVARLEISPLAGPG